MKKSRSLIIDLTLYSAIFLLIFPILVLILWSFVKSWPWPYLLPKEMSLRGFQSLLRPESGMSDVLLCSICLSISVTFLTLALSIPASKALALMDFKGKKIIKWLFFAPLIVPAVSYSMGIHLAFIKTGLANTFMGVVLVHLLPCVPYGISILTDVFEIIGDKLELQSKMLGAKPFQTFLYITLPMIMPGVLSAGSLIFIVSFSQYFLTFLIGGGRVITLPIVMFPYIQSGDRTMASSYSIIFIITSLIVLLLLERLVKSYYKTENHFYI